MAPYSDTQTVGFNFGIDIVTRFEFLQTLGIDIFANQEYDTWVLHTIAARIQNNAHHGASVEPHQLLALHPLYSFFNHSCARNAFWEPREDQVNSLFVTATTKIKRGEEIFISYHGVEDLSFQARKIVLSTWFPDGCQCERCQRE
jgi:SET domain-containing protein